MDILAVCPNPSVDVTVSAEKIEAGSLNRIPPPVITRSGKAINALKAAAILGARGVASGFMFSNDADGFADDLKGYGCSSDFVVLKGDVRRNIKLCERGGKLTELNSAGAPVGEAEKAALLKKIGELSERRAVTVVSGSLPPGCESGYYGELSRAVKSRYKLIDAEGDRLISALSSGATLVKPNAEEAAKIVGFAVDSVRAAVAAGKVIVGMGAEIALISLGKGGAVITDGVTAFFAKAPEVEVGSPVGAGDSMVGAAAAALSRLDGAINEDALRMILRDAAAAGSASVMSEGTRLFGMSGFKRTLELVTVRKAE